jgi:hypothetical protein
LCAPVQPVSRCQRGESQRGNALSSVADADLTIIEATNGFPEMSKSIVRDNAVRRITEFGFEGE